MPINETIIPIPPPTEKAHPTLAPNPDSVVEMAEIPTISKIVLTTNEIMRPITVELISTNGLTI